MNSILLLPWKKMIKLKAEIAQTPEQLARGLMFRKTLDDDSGMLFVFNRSGKHRFWGKNTYLPLDVAFIDENDRIIKISYISPLDDSPVMSEKDCQMVIEANYGYFSKNHIKEGQSISVEQINNNILDVSFL